MTTEEKLAQIASTLKAMSIVMEELANQLHEAQRDLDIKKDLDKAEEILRRCGFRRAR